MHHAADRSIRVPAVRNFVFSVLVIAAALPATLPSALAQDESTGDVVTGLQYYAIENLDRGTVDRRGIAGALGVAFSSLVLTPETQYRAWLLEATTLRIGRITFKTGLAGTRFHIPDIEYRPHETDDFDSDGLNDLAEFILGTKPDVADTDGDGVPDGAEVTQGLNPADGLTPVTGVIRSLALPGDAIDLCISGDLLVVAHGKRITGVNVFAGLSPAIVFTFNLGGAAVRIACSDSTVLVATTNGVSLLDARDPGAVVTIAQISKTELGGTPKSVTATAGAGYVGLADGSVVSIDLARGFLLGRVSVGSEVHDLAIEGKHLYALTQQALHVLALVPANMQVVGTRGVPIAVVLRRLFVGGNAAYGVHSDGICLFDVTVPTAPALVLITNTPQARWVDIALNGSGLAAVATMFNVIGPSESQDVDLYDITGLSAASDPTLNDRILTTIVTPGRAEALEIANGLAYVADGSGGLQVINYLSFDTAGVAPSIALVPDFDPAGVAEGKSVSLSASVDDDVQVRSVEFVVGATSTTDSSFPFEHRFITPRLTEQSSFRFRARVFDTGGNFTWTDEIEVPLTPDDVPPVVLATSPRGATIAPVIEISAYMDEPIDATTLTDAAFTVAGAGPDGLLDTVDDFQVAAALAFQASLLAARFTAAAELPLGLYRGRITTAITDVSGNALAADTVWYFRIYANPDLDGDGTDDGPADSDGDGLLNAYEVVLGLDPNVDDFDPLRDVDRDGLTDLAELVLGTEPQSFDSDLDGFSDGDEIAEGSDPFDTRRLPFFSARSYASAQSPAFRAVALQIGLLNKVAPEAVARKTEAQVLSVENEP